MTYEAGRFRLVYDAPADIGALVESAVREAKDALFGAGQADATLADAVAEVANRSLSALESTSRLDKYRVLVHLDTEGGWLNARPAWPVLPWARSGATAPARPTSDADVPYRGPTGQQLHPGWVAFAPG